MESKSEYIREDKVENSGSKEKKSISKFFSRHKKELITLLLAAVGAVLLIIGEFDFGKDETAVQEYTDVGFYTEYLEDKIEKMCKSISGIDEAEVLLTLDCSSEYIYGESASDYLILKKNDGEEAAMLREIYPKVRGIAVVCTGGDLPRIKETVTELLSASMGISVSKIKVAGS